LNLTDRTDGGAQRESETPMIHAVLRAAYGFVVIYSGLLVFGLGCLIWSGAAALLGQLLSKDRGRVVGRSVTRYGFRLYLWALTLTGAFRFDLSALDALRDGGPLIIAPNHPSLLDAVMVLSRLPAACVMKAELIDNPIYGASARLADYIRNDDFIGAATQAVQTLKGGSQLLLFPEGTRTTRAPINRLKGGAALVSKRSGVPIQTVFIETTSPFLSKGWPLHRIPPIPVCYRVRLGRRFTPRDNLVEAIAELETYLASELGCGHDIGTAGKMPVRPQDPRPTGR
jgi:1-acyl-sn-glycerol-3-phosphate acyltransferase